MRKQLWLRIGIVVVVITVSGWFLYPPKKTINLGLDLQGGGAVDPAAGRQPHPRPAPGRPGPRAREGPDRQDRAPRVQAARRSRGPGDGAPFGHPRGR